MKRIFLVFLFSGAVFIFLQKINVLPINVFKADISSAPPFLNAAEKIDFIPAVEEKNSEEPEQAVQEEKSISAGQMTLEEIQEAIDDIGEEIDILAAENKKSEIINSEPEIENTVTPDAKIDQKENENNEPDLIVYKKSSGSGGSGGGGGGGGGGKIEPVFCGKSEASASRNSVIFSEIAWMGTSNSANDEWMELKNITSDDIDLTSWQIQDKEQNIKISFLPKTISANGFFLLERTDDDSAPGINADYIYTGALNDENEALYLFNKNCQLEDEIIASPDWPAGNKEERRTMETSDDLTWHTYFGTGQNGIMGTPKAENSKPPENIFSTPDANPVVLINEIQVDSKNGTGGANDDWVELYNPNTFDVDISSWSIQRSPESGKIYKKNFEAGNVIPASGYFLIVRNIAKQIYLDIADMITSILQLSENTMVYLARNKEEIEGSDDLDIIDRAVCRDKILDPPTPINSKGQTINYSSDDY